MLTKFDRSVPGTPWRMPVANELNIRHFTDGRTNSQERIVFACHCADWGLPCADDQCRVVGLMAARGSAVCRLLSSTTVSQALCGIETPASQAATDLALDAAKVNH